MTDREVQAAMRRWAGHGPSPEIERAVMVEFDRVERSRRWRRYGVVAAAVAVGLAVAWIGAPERKPASQRVEQAFTPLPYVVQPARYEQTEVVRMSVPVAELRAAGFAMNAEPGALVNAEVLIGQDGRARAVRLLAE